MAKGNDDILIWMGVAAAALYVITKQKDAKTIAGFADDHAHNVRLWLNNDVKFYNAARSFMKGYKGNNPYKDFIYKMGWENKRNPDKYKWISATMDLETLNNEMYDLAAD